MGAIAKIASNRLRSYSPPNPDALAVSCASELDDMVDDGSITRKMADLLRPLPAGAINFALCALDNVADAAMSEQFGRDDAELMRVKAETTLGAAHAFANGIDPAHGKALLQFLQAAAVRRYR